MLDELQLDYIIIDSKKWQHHFFGKDTSQIDLKRSSMNLSLTILDNIEKNNGENNVSEIQDLKKEVIKHGDGDSFLICKFIEEKFN